jgi:hypothetical protein
MPCSVPVRQRNIDRLRGKINRDQRSDIGYRIVLTRYEAVPPHDQGNHADGSQIPRADAAERAACS